MELVVSAGALAGFRADAITVAVFEEVQELSGDAAIVDAALGGAISQLLACGEIRGKPNEITLVHSLGRVPAGKVAVVGLGKPAELSLNRVRGAVAEACRFLRKRGASSIATGPIGVGMAGITAEGSAQAIAEGVILGLYDFRRHITKPAEHGEVRALTIVSREADWLPELERGLHVGRITAEAASAARDMVNEPANYMTPADMAGEARRLAETYGLELRVLERPDMEALGMGGLLSVARGSQEPPKFIVLGYRGGAAEGVDIALVGKGITFDSGGISLKPSEKMWEMKGDMAGGAAVLAAMGAIARLKPAASVTALVPATENLPSGSAFKPGDVLTTLGGKTVEVISTDAEGRLILADALGYARRLGARAIVDVATLTGACVVALGKVCTGAFGNNQELIDRVIRAGAAAGELVWQMPMYEEYKEQNKSDVADIKNVGGREAGAITAAQFLAEFAGDTPWVHLDIAGTSMTDKERNYLVKGATGVPVRTLVNLVLSLAK